MFFLLLTHLPVHYFARPEGSAILITLYGYCMAHIHIHKLFVCFLITIKHFPLVSTTLVNTTYER